MRYRITPVGKPRQTQRDRWKQRPAVMRYRAFRDQVRALGVTVPPDGAHITFVIPMPPSWPKWKRRQYSGQPHRQKPDKDNLEKALLDAIYDDDAHVWDSRVSKVWGEEGAIIVKALPEAA